MEYKTMKEMLFGIFTELPKYPIRKECIYRQKIQPNLVGFFVARVGHDPTTSGL